MISNRFHIALIFAVLLYFAALGLLLKKNRLLLKYSLLWIFAGVVMLLFAIWPSLLDRISRIVGIYNPANALFIIAFFCVILILISLTSIVSAMNEKIKRLVQNQALLEARIRELEKNDKGGT